jgi:hypothetical protein
MRSPGSRVAIEWALRGVAVLALVMAWREMARRSDDGPVPRAVTAATVRTSALEGLRDTLLVSLDTALDDTTRALLAARRDAGGGVRWRGTLEPSVATIDPVPGPAGLVSLVVGSAPRRPLVVRDSVGRIDSVSLTTPVTAITIAAPMGALTARVAAQPLRLRAAPGDSARRVLVLAQPGWEGKFVVAALEEAGWLVDARFPVRPDTAVVQGRPRALDGARVAVVIALDSTAGSMARAIDGFVRAGGGLVLGAGAHTMPGFAALRAGAAGARREPVSLVLDSAAPRRTLPLVPVRQLTSGAVALERDGPSIVLAARRVGAGRVVTVGVEDSWRWRMTGPAGSVDAHRRWWSALVSAAHGGVNLAHTPRVESSAAPLASMVATLGAPDRAVRRASGGPPAPARPWRWILLAMAALLVEWGVRRLRGAR